MSPDANSRLLGDSRLCDPALKPHPSPSFNSSENDTNSFILQAH